MNLKVLTKRAGVPAFLNSSKSYRRERPVLLLSYAKTTLRYTALIQIHFSINETVYLKIAAISEEQYQFWRMYDNMQSLSRNPLFPVTDNIPSNVSSGIGYWFGYASVNYVVSIKELVELTAF